MKNLERMYDLEYAIKVIKNTIKEMQLEYKIEEYNTINNKLKTISIILNDNVISSGKGIGN